MQWEVEFHRDFDPEFNVLPESVRNEIIAVSIVLKKVGPLLGRPHVDTLKGSHYSNMKELRFNTLDSVWRVAFAFDPKRRAILLVAGNKSGVSEKRFYRQLIEKADSRFSSYLSQMKMKRF